MGVGLTIAKAILGGIGGGFNGAVEGAQTADLESGSTNHLKAFSDRAYSAGNLGGDKIKEKIGGMMKMAQGMGGGEASGSDASSGADAAADAGSAGADAAADAGSAAADAAAAIGDGIVRSKGMKQYIKRNDGTVIPLSSDVTIYATKKEIDPNTIGKGTSVGREQIKRSAEETKTARKYSLSDINLKDVYQNIDDKLIEDFSKIASIDFTYSEEAQNKYKGEYGVDDQEHIGVIAQELETNPATKGIVKENENGDKVVDTKQLTMADTAVLAELSRRVLALEEAFKNINGGIN